MPAFKTEDPVASVEHNEKKPHICDTCYIVFVSENRLANHCLSFSEQKPCLSDVSHCIWR